MAQLAQSGSLGYGLGLQYGIKDTTAETISAIKGIEEGVGKGLAAYQKGVELGAKRKEEKTKHDEESLNRIKSSLKIDGYHPALQAEVANVSAKIGADALKWNETRKPNSPTYDKAEGTDYYKDLQKLANLKLESETLFKEQEKAANKDVYQTSDLFNPESPSYLFNKGYSPEELNAAYRSVYKTQIVPGMVTSERPIDWFKVAKADIGNIPLSKKAIKTTKGDVETTQETYIRDEKSIREQGDIFIKSDTPATKSLLLETVSVIEKTPSLKREYELLPQEQKAVYLEKKALDLYTDKFIGGKSVYSERPVEEKEEKDGLTSNYSVSPSKRKLGIIGRTIEKVGDAWTLGESKEKTESPYIKAWDLKNNIIKNIDSAEWYKVSTGDWEKKVGAREFKFGQIVEIPVVTGSDGKDYPIGETPYSITELLKLPGVKMKKYASGTVEKGYARLVPFDVVKKTLEERKISIDEDTVNDESKQPPSEKKEKKDADKISDEKMFIVNGKAYKQSALEKQGYDITKLTEYKP